MLPLAFAGPPTILMLVAIVAVLACRIFVSRQKALNPRRKVEKAEGRAQTQLDALRGAAARDEALRCLGGVAR